MREHFRCVHEIIQFSNERFHGGVIEPLRIPGTQSKLSPAVIAVKVEEGLRSGGNNAVNEPEAEAVIEKIVSLCAKQEYLGKSMGVISLQSKDQAFLIEQKIRELLGEREMLARNIVCGYSYSFQGDEREVVFLSMVAAPNIRLTTLNKRSDEYRFNVAASRAREQMWLFHSVELSQLNPDCIRYNLLQYCLHPRKIQGDCGSCRGNFPALRDKYAGTRCL